MIIKSYDLNEIKKSKSNLFLLYGENEGSKEDIIQNCFLPEFEGEIIKYDENQVLDNKDEFFEICLNDSLFNNKKIILISRITLKLYEIIKELLKRKLNEIKIIFIAGILEKKSKIRRIFEEEKNLVCIPFYQDNNESLFKMAKEYFNRNKISISAQNINLIVDKSSGDRKKLQNEIEKILNFCFNKNKIDRNEILKLINLYEDENYFNLIDSCLIKNNVKVCKIINNNTFKKEDYIILIRSFLSRLKRLLELKKMQKTTANLSETINNFRPPIFWRDKEIVQKQIEIWSTKEVYKLLDKANDLELKFKKNSSFSNNLVFDFILNTSNS